MTIINETEKYELKYMYQKFVSLFEDKMDSMLIASVSSNLALYIIFGEQDKLEEFVKEYFNMKRLIVENKNKYIDLVQSSEFKDEKLINKIKTRKQLKHWQKLCDKLNLFDKEFYERTNISLLRVENERWAKNKKQEKENREI